MSKRRALSDFEGKTVSRSTVAITNAGDGLSDSMKVEPTEFHQGETHYVVLECEVTKVAFAPMDREDPGGAQKRVHYFKAGTATIVDPSLVADLIKAQSEKNLRAAEAEAGIQRLPIDDDPDPVVTRVRNWLRTLKKSELVELCDQWKVAYPLTDTGKPKPTALELIDLLAANANKIKHLAGED